MKKILFVLFLSAGFSFLITTTASAFFVSALSKIPTKRIVRDYGIKIDALPARIRGGHQHAYIAYMGQPNPIRIFRWIETAPPSGANACINFRMSYGYFICEYVKLVPKK
jgi:uncharacterized protein YbjQ (UPF0145 family)